MYVYIYIHTYIFQIFQTISQFWETCYCLWMLGVRQQWNEGVTNMFHIETPTFFNRWVITIENSCLGLFVLSIPAAGSSWAASHGDMLIPRQHKAGEAAFLAMKTPLPWNASQCWDQANSDQTIPLVFTEPPSFHPHELCPESNGQELGWSLSAGSRVVSWWAHSQNS